MELSKNAFEPLYYQIRENIREKINNGEYSPNSLIPSEAELCEIYNVSRITARRAILDLVQEGVLNRGKGRGTFVSESYSYTTMNGAKSFTQELLGISMRPSAKLLGYKIRKPDQVLQSIMGLNQFDEVITISRLRLVNNEPCMVEVMDLPYKMVQGIENEDLEKSIYSLLKDNYHREVVFAKDILEAIIIGEYESKLLELPNITAGLRTTRIGEDANHQVIEHTTHIIAGKKCKLVLNHTK